MNPVHEVDTQLGKLVVYESKDPEYPGVHILLRRNNHELLLAVVESGESPFHKNPRLQLTIYGDPLKDEPTHVADIEPDSITKCFAEIFGEKEGHHDETTI